MSVDKTLSRHSDSKFQIIYIAGPGRNGTTILDILLGQGEDTQSLGELGNVLDHGFIQDQQCSCGKSPHDCQLWSQVLDALPLEKGETIRDLVDLQAKFDWHWGVPRFIFGIFSKAQKQRYKALEEAIFQTLHQASGKEVLIDSSKFPARLLSLSHFTNLDIKPICITRDPLGVIRSFDKVKENGTRKGLLATVYYYCVVLTMIRISQLFLRHALLIIRYEDLINKPIPTLQKIENHTGISLTTSIDRVKNKEILEISHIVSGNHLRHNKEVRFRAGSFKRKKADTLGEAMGVFIMSLWRNLLLM